MSAYAIGDLQGCFFSFQSLLSTLDFNVKEDELWLVGDIVNRGKGSLEVLDWCYKHQNNIKIVLGNHDLHFLAVAFQVKSISAQDTIQPILKHKNLSKYIDWLLSIPLAYGNDKYLMVHAGVAPSWSTELTKKLSSEVSVELNRNPKIFLKEMYGNQPPVWNKNDKKHDRLRFAINTMTRMRVLNQDGAIDFSFKQGLDKIPPNLIPWFLFPSEVRKEYVLSGHWSAIGVHRHEKGISLDSGCVWGKKLSAYRFSDKKVISISADPRDLY